MAGLCLECLLPLKRGRLYRYGPGLYVRESHSPERASECAGRACNSKFPLERSRPPFPDSTRRTQSRAFLRGFPMRAAHAAAPPVARCAFCPGVFCQTALAALPCACVSAIPSPSNRLSPCLCRSGVLHGSPFCEGQHQASLFGLPAFSLRSRRSSRFRPTRGMKPFFNGIFRTFRFSRLTTPLIYNN